MTHDPETVKWLETLLMSSRKRSEKLAEILDYFEPEKIHDVVVRNTHAAIERVEMYGLEIGVDANGYASEVHFPDGAYSE